MLKRTFKILKFQSKRKCRNRESPLMPPLSMWFGTSSPLTAIDMRSVPNKIDNTFLILLFITLSLHYFGYIICSSWMFTEFINVSIIHFWISKSNKRRYKINREIKYRILYEFGLNDKAWTWYDKVDNINVDFMKERERLCQRQSLHNF